jgi:xanthine dehydrogenase accessory factor
MSLTILIRGGGDLASGVALRLFRAGLQVIITEIPQPLSVRRLVSFAEAIYQGEITIEGVKAEYTRDSTQIFRLIEKRIIPVIVDPKADIVNEPQMKILQTNPLVIIDGRMTKAYVKKEDQKASLLIGLGPGFIAGENCQAAIETNRGHHLGRVIWEGATEEDTGVPESVSNKQAERVLRSPADGILTTYVDICDHIKVGIGDIDPRDDPSYCTLVSDKSLAVGGGVLEAILSRVDLRPFLWSRHAIN